MGDLTKNLSKREFACQCGKCGLSVADFELVNVLQAACDYFANELGVGKVSLAINSGNRCKFHNRSEGGSTGSHHTYPKFNAVDFRIGGVSADKVADYLEKEYPDKYGIGRYKGRTHLDTRPAKARWDMR